MKRALCVLVAAAAAVSAAGDGQTLPLRSRVELYRGSGDWRELRLDEKIRPERSAIILCDMWDKHWCRGATGRVGQLIPKINPVLDQARRRGMLVIHAPSETMDFYKEAPQRLAAASLSRTAPAAVLDLAAPALPIDDSDGGCDTGGDKFYKAWSRQHPGIVIGEKDLITDKGDEVFSALKLRGIETLFVAGVHTNMCILNRSFAIKQMTKWGVRCVLLRDLTDSMYNPNDRPFVAHDQGTELVVQHIEKYWAPSALSADLLAVLKAGPR